MSYSTVRFRNKTVKYIKIFHSALQLWSKNGNYALNSQQTTQNSPSRESYGMVILVSRNVSNYNDMALYVDINVGKKTLWCGMISIASPSNSWGYNKLWSNAAICQYKNGSALAQVMTYFLTAPSHYMIQCWLIISKVLWHSPLG